MTDDKEVLPLTVAEALKLDPPHEGRALNCMSCEGVACVELNPDNVYTNKDLDLTLNMPAYVCSKCDTVVYEPDTYAKILEAEEAHTGRPYIKVEIKNGKISKYSVH